MTPEQEAEQIINKFYTLFDCSMYSLAEKCALVHVKELIKSLEKNKGYTQCFIDLKHYEAVKSEIESLIRWQNL